MYLLDLMTVGDFRGVTSLPPTYRASGIFLAIDIDGDQAISAENELFDIRSPFRVGGTHYRVSSVTQSGDSITFSSIPQHLWQ